MHFDGLDDFQSRDETAMLVHKSIANYGSNSQKTFFSIVLCTNVASVTSGENHLLWCCSWKR